MIIINNCKLIHSYFSFSDYYIRNLTIRENKIVLYDIYIVLIWCYDIVMQGDVVMIDSLSNKLVNYLDKGNYLDEDKEIYLHGAKLIISEVIGTLLLLVLGLMTNHFIEAVCL